MSSFIPPQWSHHLPWYPPASALLNQNQGTDLLLLSPTGAGQDRYRMAHTDVIKLGKSGSSPSSSYLRLGCHCLQRLQEQVKRGAEPHTNILCPRPPINVYFDRQSQGLVGPWLSSYCRIHPCGRSAGVCGGGQRPGIHTVSVVPGQGHTSWVVAFPERWDGTSRVETSDPGLDRQTGPQ